MIDSCEKCGATLPFDPSDPVPECPLPKGHDGPHIVDGCIEFTDEQRAEQTILHVKEIYRVSKEQFGEEFTDTWEDCLRWFGIDERGYPKDYDQE